MESQPVFPDAVPGVDDTPTPEPAPEVQAEAVEPTPPPQGEGGGFDWNSFGEQAEVLSVEEEPPRRERTARGSMGPLGADMADFFTEDGIGKIAARGVDGFYKTCGAEPMDRAEFNQMAKVFAYWCRARLPADAKDYQPEILLIATIGMTTLPRLGPVVQAAVPWWRRGWQWFRGLWSRKGQDNGQSD